ncbi:MAG TPA: PKD domain-containing protein, partial [Flavobacteriales bacterium]|nr:PKD domain-containing protein [Flavobacteriales bacterium]
LAQFTTTPHSGCHPLTAQMTNNSTGAISYHWNYGDGAVSDTALAVHEHTWYNYAGPGAIPYPISLTVTTAHGCTNTSSSQVDVFPEVTAAFVSDSVGCAPLPIDFINVSTGASTYHWTFGDQQGSMATSPSHTYQNQGFADATFTAQLIATSTFGCSDTVAHTILVHPQPIAQFVPGLNAGCQPLTVSFQNMTIGADSVLWQFGDGAVLAALPTNTTHTYTHSNATATVFDAVLIATTPFGCSDTAMKPIEVYPAITASFTVNSSGCSPVTVQPVNNSTGASSYQWDMGDGTILVGASPTYTYINTTAFDQVRVITLTATSPFGCVSTTTQTVMVYPVPSAAFQATPFTQQFPDATVAIVNNSASGNWLYDWQFGDGQVNAQQSPGTHTYSTWGTFTITLIVSGTACSDTVTQAITITPPLPTASFIGQGEGCEPLTVSFTNT